MTAVRKVFYVSKYASLPPARAGLRGFRLLEELSHQGQSCTLITSSSNHLNESCLDGVPNGGRVNVRVVGAPKYRRGESFSRLLSWIVFDLKVAFLPLRHSEKPDFVIASSPSLLTFLSGYCLARRFRALFVIEVRDIWPLTATEEFGYSGKSLLVWFARRIERFGFSSCDGAVGLMPKFEDYAREKGGGEVRATSIGLGIDQADTIGVPTPISPRKNRPLTVGYAGSVGKSNYLETLLEVASSLEFDSNFRFEIAGDGDLLDSYRKKYRHLANVTFHGSIPRAEVTDFLWNCDVLYFSSPNTEISKYGQSLNKIVEYMLSGRPILGSYSGHITMVNEACCGWIEPAGDEQALVSRLKKIALMDERVLTKVGLNGYHWITENRSYRVLSQDYLAFLMSLEPGSAGRSLPGKTQ